MHSDLLLHMRIVGLRRLLKAPSEAAGVSWRGRLRQRRTAESGAPRLSVPATIWFEGQLGCV